jgi:carboxymethylenebutenolidase
MVQPKELLKDLFAPVLYHRAGADTSVTAGDIEQFQAAAAEYRKTVEIAAYADAPRAFTNEMKPDAYRPDTTAAAWERTAAFLKTCFQGT